MTIDTRFVGSIPALYDRHLGPVLFEPYAKDLAQRLPPSVRRILEIAAGTGRLTRQLLAVMAADAELLATDLNDPMLDVARSLVGPDPRVTWRQVDAQALPIADGSVDAVTCQFGLMFVPDKPRALAEMRRVLAAGGILLLSTWDDLARNPASAALHELAYAAMPTDPPTFMRTPFSMHDAHELAQLATAAGFRDVQVETVCLVGEAQSAAHLATGFVRGNPLWNQLTERGIDGAALEARVTAELARRFSPGHQTDPACKTPLSAHVLTAFA
jgi:ubiquinone/menaquinone biosynthesis C-methylase UbiE